ncbi:hypothetical protein ACSHUI_00120 [Bacillus subtilis]|uniref:hypothetical protein n=1 Tax=Bacillus phage SP10 TaxID=941058 RepID=UPI0002198B9E|nr:hypothetical protein [Bacillus subtilis]YP_007003459.1 hypothetical protein F373_gp202 [Bacillus phage SP-10]WCS68076.1 hypothetical protein Goe26_01640 [Bacillus phage vB_BsuM-Goe26]BAK53014.1 hypothetical protein [Bacillus phage SP-10]GLI90433.1 hypothetical protein ANABIO4_37850 [Bacillus subtilis]
MRFVLAESNVLVPDNLKEGVEPAKEASKGFFQEGLSSVSGAILDLFKPIGEALGDGMYLLFQNLLAHLPLTLTVVGMCLFVLSIFEGRARFYSWGLTSWALSAVIRIIGHSFGV